MERRSAQGGVPGSAVVLAFAIRVGGEHLLRIRGAAGGKALGKRIAMEKSREITHFCARVLCVFGRKKKS